MDHVTPTRNEILAMDRLTCTRCGAEALTLSADGLALCARHATMPPTAKTPEGHQADPGR